MIFTTQGLPPIIVHNFDELKTELNNNSQGVPSKINTKKSNDNKNNEESEVSVNGGSENKINRSNLKEIADKLKEILTDDNILLQFSHDDESNKMILKIINSDTKEVLRQYPPEISLQIARIVAENGRLANATV